MRHFLALALGRGSPKIHDRCVAVFGLGLAGSQSSPCSGLSNPYAKQAVASFPQIYKTPRFYGKQGVF